ncbi:MAG: GNAT family N-acetyltransferase [Emcibacteraceae bacterium]|nr:GNAT family N-acetyltransferase [Emcibacteraceae bacterium]
MSKEKHTFQHYAPKHKDECLGVLDDNCPEYFAYNERDAYEEFLDSNPQGYEVCIIEGKITGVYGLIKEEHNTSRINWIMLGPHAHGHGLGSIFVNRAIKRAKAIDATVIHIATSHKAFKFFEKFNAVIVSEVEDGWGPGMHQVHMEIRL